LLFVFVLRCASVHTVSAAAAAAAATGCCTAYQHIHNTREHQNQKTKTTNTTRAHVGLRQVPVERRRVELRQGVDLGHVGVDAVADGDVDEPVVGAERHRGLGAVLGQRVEARAGAAAEDDAEHGLFCFVFGLCVEGGGSVFVDAFAS
jgi:hypothetical protein